MKQDPTAQRHARLLRLATYASTSTALILVVAKLVSWSITGSVSLLASLVDSLMDAFASLVTLLAVRLALRPADHEHRFGHGKAESLAGLGQSGFILGSGLFLLYQSLDRLIHPQPLQDTAVGVGVMLFAIFATALLLAFQRHVVAETGSTAIKADALHYRADLLTNASVVAALGVYAAFGWQRADPLFALAIAAYILFSAWQIATEAVHALMDRELPDADRGRILSLAAQHPRISGVHDLRTRQSGRAIFIQLHLELDGRLSLTEAHAISDEVRDSIEAVYPAAEVTIHQDPVPGDAAEDARHLQHV
jgi:ferrous-iron efflux pump FieF